MGGSTCGEQGDEQGDEGDKVRSLQGLDASKVETLTSPVDIPGTGGEGALGWSINTSSGSGMGSIRHDLVCP
jgi:hypothetical protein